MQPVVILFDVDGVLVQPGGYRAAVRATVNHFTQLMGLGDLAPDDETVAIYEAQGITSEWDMVPLTLAIILESAVTAFGPALPLDSLATASDWLRSQQVKRNVQALQIDYAPTLRTLGRFVKPGVAPAEAIYAASQDGLGGVWLPNLSGQPVLRELLLHTRAPARSITTHVFETLALGDAVFSHALGIPAALPAESLLARHDRPLLRPDVRDRLNALQRADRLRLAAYTARPSLPVTMQPEGLAVFAPEAEMALEQVGLESIRLVGSGQTGEMARHMGESEDRLTKPSPYHAVAAACAAWTGDRREALKWTEAVFRHFEHNGLNPGRSTGAGPLPALLTLHVFEDSPTGLSGAKDAALLLQQVGIAVDLHLWGVTGHAEKSRALERVGGAVYSDVNQALEEALAGLL